MTQRKLGEGARATAPEAGIDAPPDVDDGAVALVPDEPVFAAPWEASAFALAVHLGERGTFSPAEWTERLGRTIDNTGPDLAYYEQWLSALESLCIERGLLSDAEIRSQIEAWRHAYLTTPHGQPVHLGVTEPRGSTS